MTTSSQSLSAELLVRICEVVDSFDAAWQAVVDGAMPPRIEEVLNEIAVIEHPAFLRELLGVELECRLRFGEQPTTDEYVSRFPQHAELIDAIVREVRKDQTSHVLIGQTSFDESAIDAGSRPGVRRSMPRSDDIGFKPGDVVHDYVLLEKLGQGGMGTVYKARHSRLKKTVALKVLPTARTRDPDAVARFQREMEAVGQLRHPHVVEAYDAGEAEGTHYLVIEYVAGMDVATVIRSIGEPPSVSKHEVDFDTGITPSQNSQSQDTLASTPPASDHVKHSPLGLPRWFPRFCTTQLPQWIRWRKSAGTTPTSGVAGFSHSHPASDAPASQPNLPSAQPNQPPARKISVADACEIIRQTALGLQHAHERGLIHRDIKPSNLLLSTEGLVKVLDLGLARLQSEHPAGNLTSTGQVMGTVDYISPEQVLDSHQVDARSDLYSLGCTLHHLLSGHPPYHGAGYSSAYQKMKAHETVAPPPIARQDIPSGVLAVLDKLLRKQPSQRFASAGEVSAALAPFTAGCDLIRLLDVANGAEPLAPNSPMAGSAAPLTAELTEATDLRPPYRTARRSWGLWATGAAVLVTLAVWGMKSRQDSPDSTTSPPASTSSSVSPAIEESKDPDRAAAEWVLSVGGLVRVRVAGQDGLQDVRAADSLPKEPFTIEVVVLSQQADLPRDELRRLAQLRGLIGLHIAGCPTFGDDDLFVFRPALRNFQRLVLDGTGVTDAGLVAIRDSSEMRSLVLTGGRITDAAVDHIAVLPRLEGLDLSYTQISDRGLAALPAMPSLQNLSFAGTRITGSGCVELSKFPNLVQVYVGELGINGFEYLAKLPQLEILGIVLREATPATMDALSKAPKLRRIAISSPDYSPLIPSQIEPLAKLPHLEELSITRMVLDSTAWQQVAKLNGLTRCECLDVTLTDDDLQQFVPHKTLKSLYCVVTKLTPAGLAKFRVVRPDVQIETDITEPKIASDRSAAEWVLSVGGEVAIQVGDDKHNIKRLADLPPGMFQITFVAFNGGDVTDDGLLNLRGLRALADLRLLNTSRVTPQGMQVVQSLPNLQTLILHEKSFTDAHLAPLRDCPKLHFLVLNGAESMTDSGVESLIHVPKLDHLDLSWTPLTNAGLKRLLASPKLSSLILGGTKVTDEGLKVLANDPRWTNLGIGAPQTAKGVDNLEQLPNLTFFNAVAECLPDASFEVSRFPKLQTLAVIGNNTLNGPLTANHFSRIARFRQIESLFLFMADHVESAGLAELSKLDRLTSIRFESVPLSDEGLAQLANHPSLKQVALHRTQVTATGLAKFRAARPEVMVETDIK